MLNFGKVCNKSVEFQNKFSRTFESKNFKIIKFRLRRNYCDQYFKKNLMKYYK